MFNFDRPEDGSQERFQERVENWKSGTPAVVPVIDTEYQPPVVVRRIPLMQHYFWWLVHNMVAHPAIGVCPVRATFKFHDWTSHKLNGL